MLYGPRAELHARVEDGQRWTMAVFDDARFRDVFDRLPAARDGRAVHLPGLLARAPGLLGLDDVAAGIAAGTAGAAVSQDVVDGLCAQLDGAFAAPARRVRADGRAARVASAAVAYLEAAQGRAVFSDEIGAAVGVSPRFVNQCFDAVFGMSVHRYLRLRRLAEARRRLMGGGWAAGEAGRARPRPVALRPLRERLPGAVRADAVADAGRCGARGSLMADRAGTRRRRRPAGG